MALYSVEHQFERQYSILRFNFFREARIGVSGQQLVDDQQTGDCISLGIKSGNTRLICHVNTLHIPELFVDDLADVFGDQLSVIPVGGNTNSNYSHDLWKRLHERMVQKEIKCLTDSQHSSLAFTTNDNSCRQLAINPDDTVTVNFFSKGQTNLKELKLSFP